MKISIFILLFWASLQEISAQTCADSSYRVRYSSANDYSIRDHVTTLDNGAVMVGAIYDNADTLAKGIIIRIDNGGEIVWSRKITNGTNSIYLSKVIQMSDGSYIISGYIRLTDNTKQNIFLAKLDAAGNLIWNNLYEHTAHFNPTDELAFFSLTEGNNRDILTAWNGVHGGNNYDSSYAVISRLNSSGVPIWSKAFVSNDDVLTHPSGIYSENNSIVIVGQVWDQAIPCPPPQAGLLPGLYFGMKVSEATGILQLLKSYCYNEIPSNQSWGISSSILNRFFSSTKIGSDQYALFGLPQGLTNLNYFYYYVVFDQQMNMVKTKRFKTPRFSGTYPQAFLKSNGDININLIGARSYWAAIDSADNIKRQKKMSFNATSGFSGFTNFSYKYPDITTLVTNYSIGSNKFSEFIQLQDNDESINSCLGSDTSFVERMPFSVTPVTWNWKYIIDNPVISSPGTFIASDTLIIKESICQQISRCDTLKIIGADTVCVIGQQEEYTVFKNPECRKHISWQFDTTVISLANQINDSTIQIRFETPLIAAQQTTLYASITGNCGTLKDSLKISLLPTLKPIGNDTVICPGQQIHLTPGYWFKEYLWQDGSTDSVFIATQPGTYYVRVQAYCGYYMNDTIQITRPQVVLNHLTSKCNGDSITVKAIADLNNYSWSPNYNLIAVSDSVIRVFPDSSTYYTITALTNNGCTIKDSILVTVNHSLAIYLGNDTSFCQGSSIVLDAGAGFIDYQWSNESPAQTISINSPGIYSITAKDNNGCFSKDTLQVLSLLPKPVISLHDQNILCKQQNDTLHIVNGFTSYLWQDGTTNSFYPVIQPGTYWAEVINSSGCKTSDTVTIIKLFASPADFIFTDTIICKGGSVLLLPNKTFSEYLWNTGAVSSSIRVNVQGAYSLRVTDQYGCKGEENILVKDKDCLNKILFPSGFTPNNDGKNDLFKPYVDGVLLHYELAIYNRWGQIVFKTKDYNFGWNGTLAGSSQDNAVFVWMCRYQFNNQKPEMQKGTFTLIR
jgi:gliding motility-associated-like protein